MADNVTVRMHKSKETKGTYVYTANKEDAVVPTLYIKKDAFPDGAPEKIAVIIKDKDAG